MLRTLLTAGAVELIESPDRPCSISVVPGGDKDGGLTEDSWTFQKKKERLIYLQENINIDYHRSYRFFDHIMSKVFTWHFRLQTLLPNVDTCQGPCTVNISPFCHFQSLNTWHLSCHTHCSSYFRTRRKFYSSFLSIPKSLYSTLIMPLLSSSRNSQPVNYHCSWKKSAGSLDTMINSLEVSQDV